VWIIVSHPIMTVIDGRTFLSLGSGSRNNRKRPNADGGQGVEKGSPRHHGARIRIRAFGVRAFGNRIHVSNCCHPARRAIKRLAAEGTAELRLPALTSSVRQV
jgi:hypothetical protein